MKKSEAWHGEKRWALAVVVAFVLFISAAWVVFDEIFSPMDQVSEVVVIPDYMGMQSDEVQAPSWLAVEREYRYDADVPAGEVMGQSPVGGSRRKRSDGGAQCKVVLTVSLGTEEVLLPNVISQRLQVAESTLRAAGFAVEREFVTGAYPEGEVFDMSPMGGTLLPRGSRVRLSVSAGVPAVTVTVPDLCGMQRGDALTALWLSQLSVADVIEIDSDETPGTVVRQNYQPGTVVMAGTRLTLYVSRQRDV